MSRLIDIIKKEAVYPSLETIKTAFPAVILDVNYNIGTATIKKLTGKDNTRIKDVNITYSQTIKGDLPEIGDLVYADFNSSYNKAIILQVYKKEQDSSFSSSNMRYKNPSYLNNPSYWV